MGKPCCASAEKNSRGRVEAVINNRAGGQWCALTREADLLRVAQTLEPRQKLATKELAYLDGEEKGTAAALGHRAPALTIWG